MKEKPVLPTEESVLSTLKLLFGSDVAIDDDLHDETEIHNEAGDTICAIYLDDDDEPLAAALCDPHFSAYAGASLSMLSKEGADHAVARGELPDPLLDNLKEVMLICAPLFMNDQSAHVRLGAVYQSPDEMPDAARSLLSSGHGPSYGVDIPRYGRGSVKLVVS